MLANLANLPEPCVLVVAIALACSVRNDTDRECERFQSSKLDTGETSLPAGLGGPFPRFGGLEWEATLALVLVV